MIKHIMRRSLVGILAVSMLIVPVSAYAADVPPDNEKPVAESNEPVNFNKSEIGTNNSTVNINYGSVDINKSIIMNNGTEDNKKGTVNTNERFINKNFATVLNNNGGTDASGQVVHNYGNIGNNKGEVDNNYGTVKCNEKTDPDDDFSGIVNNNMESGVVEENKAGGVIFANSGTIKHNAGTVNNNRKTIGINCGKVFNNAGTVTDNLGTVTDNLGEVIENKGTITNNFGGKITGTCALFEFYEYVLGDGGMVDETGSDQLRTAGGRTWVGTKQAEKGNAKLVVKACEGKILNKVVDESGKPVNVVDNKDDSWSVTGISKKIVISWKDKLHVCKGDAVAEVPATCTEDGCKAYWYCSECNTYFADKDCKTTIEDLEAWKSKDGKIAKTGKHTGGTATCTEKAKCEICGAEYGNVTEHKYAETWSFDAENHWHECEACHDKKDVAAHTLVTTATNAGIGVEGKIETICTDCNNVIKTDLIPAIATVKLSQTSYTYNKKAQKPSVIVTDSEGTVIDKSNYTVKYSSGRKKVGKYTVTVTFQGNYKGSDKLTFTINPPKPSISKVKAGKKSFTVNWSKKTTEVTGYQIQYSTSKKFSGKLKTVTVKSAKTASKAISKLDGNRKYYVRIRIYKTVSGKKYYSDWSSVKSVKTKK